MGRDCERGMTLIELVVVLAIMALTIAVAAATMTSRAVAPRLQPVAVRLAADLKLARADAIASNRTVEVVFDVRGRSYRVRGAGTPVVLPAAIGLSVRSTAGLEQTIDVDRVVFQPDGSSSGLEVTIGDQRARITLVVDWLTGTVTALRGQP